MSRYRYLEDKAKLKGKILLIENVSLHIDSKNIEIFDKPRIIESVDNGSYTARAIIKNVPVSKFTENLNGRIYNKQLDERIINNGLAEGNLSLADHPEDDGSITRICGVWHNPRMDDKYSYGDWYLVGDHGQLILETIKAGGKIGVSRVGFGEILEDGKTVDPDSYELQRYGDAVVNPSQEVFATYENLTENISESIQKDIIKEIIINEKNIIENKTTNILTNVLEQNEVKNDMSEKFIEASLRMQVKQLIKEAENSTMPVDSIKDLQEVLKTVPATMVEDIVKLENTISKLQEKIEVEKVLAQKELKESKETLESLSKKYEVANQTIEGMKKQLEKANTLVEKAVNPDLEKSIKMMEADLSQFTKDRPLMENDIKCLTEKIAIKEAELKAFEEDTILRDKDIAKFKEERKALRKKVSVSDKALKEAEKHISDLEKTLKEDFGYDFDDEMIDDSMEDEDEIYSDEDLADYDYMEDEGGLTGNGDIDDYMFVEEDDEDKDEEDDKVEEADDSEDDDKEEIEESDDEDDKEEVKEDDEDDDKMAALRAKKEQALRRKRIELKKQEDAKKKEVKPEIKKESKSKVVEAVQQYYMESIRKTPAIKDIRSSIMSSTSLSEAIEKVQRFKSKRFGNDMLKLDESSKKKDQYVDYKFDINED